MTTVSPIRVPEGGAKIVPGQPVPDNPIVPFIEGDGIGVDITPVMKDVVDAAIEKAYGGEREIHWMEIFAGEKSTKVYGADGVDLSPAAAKQLAQYESLGFGKLPICMAKSQYSLSHDAALKGRPTGFRVPIREVRLSAGAGFVTPLAGEMRTMPGLPSRPGGENIDIDTAGEILGLF